MIHIHIMDMMGGDTGTDFTTGGGGAVTITIITDGTDVVVAGSEKGGSMKTVLFVCCLVFFSACAVTPQQYRVGAGALTGSAIGAGLGAATGAIFGNPGGGAATGAILGGALGAANASQSYRGGYGSGYGGQRPVMDCGLGRNEEEIAACRRGQQTGSAQRAPKIAAVCKEVAYGYGFEGRGYPGEIVAMYGEGNDLYEASCRRGVGEGYDAGQVARLKGIEDAARRHESGESSYGGGYGGGDPWGRPSFWDAYRR